MTGLKVLHASDESVRVLDGDVELLRYVVRPGSAPVEAPKPYLHPVRTRGGRLVSLLRPDDHPWHTGIAWALPIVGDENFWGGPTFVRDRGYLQLDNVGQQRHRGPTSVVGAGAQVRIEHDLDWLTHDGRPLFAEHRSLTLRLLDATTWSLVFETSMTSVADRPIRLGSPTTRGRDNAGYGGLFWRGSCAFVGGRLVSEHGAGSDELRGLRAAWMGCIGRPDAGEPVSTVLMVDATTNPHHPPQWFARVDGSACLNPAPFFSDEVEVAPRAAIGFRVGVVVADGDRQADAPQLARAVQAVLEAGTPGSGGGRCAASSPRRP